MVLHPDTPELDDLQKQAEIARVCAWFAAALAAALFYGSFGPDRTVLVETRALIEEHRKILAAEQKNRLQNEAVLFQNLAVFSELKKTHPSSQP